MSGFWVYKEDGTLQCGMGKEISLEEMRAEIEGLVGKENVVAAEKRRLPIFVSQRCGAPTANVNAYELTPDGAFIFQRGIVGPMGFHIWTWGDVDAPTGGKRSMSAGDNPTPWPWLRTAFAASEESGASALMNLISSASQAGSQPTTIAELKGHLCRFYKTGDPLTMDFRPERVNIEHDEDFVIKRVWFG